MTDNDDLMIINKSGITLRLHVSDVRIMGRATQGVRLINLGKRGDIIASVCRVPREDSEEDTNDEFNDENTETSVQENNNEQVNENN